MMRRVELLHFNSYYQVVKESTAFSIRIPFAVLLSVHTIVA